MNGATDTNPRDHSEAIPNHDETTTTDHNYSTKTSVNQFFISLLIWKSLSRVVRRRGSWPRSGRGDDDHPDIRGSAEPVPHDSEPSPNCPHTKRVDRNHITGQRGLLGMLCPPDHDRRRRPALHAAAGTSSSSWPTAQTNPASSRATAVSALCVPIRALRWR